MQHPQCNFPRITWLPPGKIGIPERMHANAQTMTKIEVFLYFYISRLRQMMCTCTQRKRWNYPQNKLLSTWKLRKRVMEKAECHYAPIPHAWQISWRCLKAGQIKEWFGNTLSTTEPEMVGGGRFPEGVPISLRVVCTLTDLQQHNGVNCGQWRR